MQLSLLTLALTKIYPKGQFTSSNLDLDFTSGNDTLDSRITFSRASNATVVGKDGTIQYAPHNLLTYSEQFDNAAWLKSNATVTANVISAPDGSTTADKIEATDSAPTSLFQSLAFTGSACTGSVYVKKGSGEKDANRFYIRDNTTATTLLAVAIDYDTRAITYVTGTTGADVVDVGNGWLRVTLSVASGLVSGNLLRFGVCFIGNNETAGEFAYAWGAQLNVGALQPYYPTTVKNLLGYTQEFDNAAWLKANSSVTANATTAPDGSVTADLFLGSGSGAHYLYTSYTATAGTPFMLSCRVKNFNLTGSAEVWLRDFTESGLARFNLATGTVNASTGIASDASITNLGDGWFLISAKFTPTVSGNHNVAPVHIAIGNTTTGYYAWGAQLSDSASLDPYVYNPGAAPTAAAYYGPRFDYDPITLQPKGLLIEEQRTNLLTYSSDFENVNWVKFRSTLIQNNIISPDGTLSGDRLIEDTTASLSHGLYQSVSISSGTAYTYTAYFKAGERSIAILGLNVGAGEVKTWFNLAAGTVLTNYGTVANIQAVGNGWHRCSVTLTSSSTTATVVVKTTYADGVENYTGNGTSGIYIWGAQLEVGSFATSYIPTTTAQVTRAADVATMTEANFSSWYRQDEGTLFAEGATIDNGTAPVFVAAQNATITHFLRINRAFNQAMGLVSIGGVTQASIFSGNTLPAGSTRKIALSYKTDDFGLSLNGGSVVTDTSGSAPTVDRLVIGAGGYGGQLNGHIRRIAYWPRRLSDAELQGITS